MTRTFEYVKVMSSLDWYIIKRVKKFRKMKGLSQLQLSILMERSESMIGKIESPACRYKYALSHLSTLAKIFECSPRDLIPYRPIPHNKVRLTFLVTQKDKRKSYKLIKEEPILT